MKGCIDFNIWEREGLIFSQQECKRQCYFQIELSIIESYLHFSKYMDLRETVHPARERQPSLIFLLQAKDIKQNTND